MVLGLKKRKNIFGSKFFSFLCSFAIEELSAGYSFVYFIHIINSFTLLKKHLYKVVYSYIPASHIRKQEHWSCDSVFLRRGMSLAFEPRQVRAESGHLTPTPLSPYSPDRWLLFPWLSHSSFHRNAFLILLFVQWSNIFKHVLCAGHSIEFCRSRDRLNQITTDTNCSKNSREKGRELWEYRAEASIAEEVCPASEQPKAGEEWPSKCHRDGTQPQAQPGPSCLLPLWSSCCQRL